MELDAAVALQLSNVATKDDLLAFGEALAKKVADKYHEQIFAAFSGVTTAAGNTNFRVYDVPDGMQFYPSRYLVWADGFTPSIANNTVTDVDSSQTGAATALAATIPGVPGGTSYITGFEVTGSGATAASVIAVTVSGILGGTKTYYVVIPAGVTTSITPLQVEFARPIPASGTNISIVVGVPSFGAGNTNQAVTAHGYQSVPVSGGVFQSNTCYGGIYHGIPSPVSLADYFPPPSGGLSEGAQPNVLPYYKEFNKHDSPEFEAPDNVAFGLVNGPPTTNITCILYGWLEEVNEGNTTGKRKRRFRRHPANIRRDRVSDRDMDATLG